MRCPRSTRASTACCPTRWSLLSRLAAHARADPGRREAGGLRRRHRDDHRAAGDARRSAARDARAVADQVSTSARRITQAPMRDQAERSSSEELAGVADEVEQCDGGSHRRELIVGAPARHVGRSRDPHRHSVPERRGDAVAGGRAGAAAAGGDAEAVPEPDPRRRTHRQSADQHARRSRRTGNCRRRVRQASCTCSRARAWIRRGSP